MAGRRRSTIACEGGFSLVEILVTLVVLAALLAIAIPSFLGFGDRADQAAARANLRTAAPAVAAYHADNDSYAGLTLAALRAYDSAVSTDVTVLSSSAAGFCLRSTHGSSTAYQPGPGADVTSTPCS